MSDYDYYIHYNQFHDTSETHGKVMAGHIKNWLTKLLPNDHSIEALDIGCGFGFAMRALSELGFRNVRGIELSPEQASVCQRTGFKVDVVKDSIEWLRQKNGTFGLILLLDVLEHVPVAAQINFLRAALGALSDGGRLILTVPNANSLLASRWRYIDFTHYSSFTEHSLFFVLKNAGFDDIRIGATKGIERFPRRFWTRSAWRTIRKMVVRWCWLQVYKAEIGWENIDDISFELNLTATADRVVSPEQASKGSG